MITYVAAYLSTAVIFLAIDFIWLKFVAQSFYRSRLDHLLMEDFNITAATGFYLVYVVGIIIFAVSPALQSGTVRTALLYGAMFGFFAYATYDMTNLATLKDWPISVVIVDIMWGSALTGTAASIGYLIARRF